MMKKILIISFCAIAFLSCQESLEKRLQREYKEYTEKNCPQRINLIDNYGNPVTLWLDSIVFSPETQTLSHYYRTSQGFDAEEQTATLLQQLKSDTKFVVHREHGYKFHYLYRLEQKPDSILYEVTFTSKDYDLLNH